MRKWSILVICIPKETCSESHKDCGPWGRVNSPTDPLGPARSYVHWLQWDMSCPHPLYDLVKETELLKRSHPVLLWKSEIYCLCVMSCHQLCWVGGLSKWGGGFDAAVSVCPLRSVACFSSFGKWWQISWLPLKQRRPPLWHSVDERGVFWTCKSCQQLL